MPTYKCDNCDKTYPSPTGEVEVYCSRLITCKGRLMKPIDEEAEMKQVQVKKTKRAAR
jgi:hypothetical protein